MFTGLVSDVGTVVAAEGDTTTLRRYVIKSSYEASTILTGASIACAGVCLTALNITAQPDGGSQFTVEAAAETLARTLVGSWQVGTPINLERSLRVGDELGGHLVTGHVDGIALVEQVVAITDGAGPWGATARFDIRAPSGLSRFIAEKGSICFDGVSLTVNQVSGDVFSVLLIPHTLGCTTHGRLKSGDRLHIEIDLMARYAARLVAATAQMQN
jgi:riboflavin synthase